MHAVIAFSNVLLNRSQRSVPFIPSKSETVMHDIKDKYETVNELLKVQKIDETRKFISESFDLIGKSESYVKTKNNIVNAIVNAKLTMASSLGIKISCITVSDFEGIKGTDLCDLLSNTLENAITACKEIADDANKFSRFIYFLDFQQFIDRFIFVFYIMP